MAARVVGLDSESMTVSRRELVVASAIAVASSLFERHGLATGSRPEVDDLDFLRKMTLDVLAASRVAPGSNGPSGWPIKNVCGFPLFTPGRGGYPAFWIRDFSMAAESGLIPVDEIEKHIELIARCQNGPSARALGSGATLPPFSIPDHINFDGRPVFFPGTYSSGEDQGGGPWGNLPPIDDHFEFVHLVWLVPEPRRSRLLATEVGGMKVVDRIRAAFAAPESEIESGLATTTEARRAVGFGFCDSVVHTGKLLFASLLRWRAANELAHMTGDSKYRAIAATIRANLAGAFSEPNSGWLLASTAIGNQPDVWGTLFALHLGVLEAKSAARAVDTVGTAYRFGTIALDGAVRHVPTNRDFLPTSAWERSTAPKGTYQNGAYWHTPTGWLVLALAKSDRKLARRAFQETIQHLRRNDYRLGDAAKQAPWECFGPNGTHAQNGGYAASVALLYASLRNPAGWR